MSKENLCDKAHGRREILTLRVDLNCDVGESFGRYILGEDMEVLQWITSANIACGFHAGDYNIMRKTVKIAVQKGVAIGAHPGLPDLLGFGRRKMEITPDEVFNLVLYQVGALSAFVKCEGGSLQHVKPHGALYHMAAHNRLFAEAIVKAVVSFDETIMVFGLSGSELIKIAKSYGLQVAQEAFADRTYQQDGALTPRSHPMAIIDDPNQVASHVLMMVQQGLVTATDGTKIPIQADTICIHGDGTRPFLLTAKIHHTLREKGIQIQSIGDKS
jgi:5-oxoprolinase (ATP-hydrolysing) subunit A